MSIPFASEKHVAITAVRRACALTDSVFNKLVKNETLTKDDKSPVTGKSAAVVFQKILLMIQDLHLAVGDYSAQAVINTILSRAFPHDPIVGEETSSDLRTSSGSSLRSRITELANQALGEDLALGEMSEWGIGPGQVKTEEELLNAIDRGSYGGGRSGRELHFHLMIKGQN
jgi:3'(2'), 5'-bisphosphate nucleotidase